MFYIAVCEDDPMQSQIILALLEKYRSERPGTDMQFHSFDSGDAVLQSIKGGQKFHLFLLDILLPGMNGIELAERLKSLHPDTPLIFLTSSADYALDAFNVSATQYILKPVKQERLFDVLDRIFAAHKQGKEHFFILNTRHGTIKILHKSIVYVERIGRTFYVHLENGDVAVSRTMRLPFSEATALLRSDNRFLCAHKSFLLNMEHINEVTSNSFILKGAVEIPIPRHHSAKAKTDYFIWLENQNKKN